MYSKELKACSQTDFYTPIVHGNIVHKSQSVEQHICLPVNEKMSKNVVQTYSGRLFSLKKKTLSQA
jgi:hypothetical protein